MKKLNLLLLAVLMCAIAACNQPSAQKTETATDAAAENATIEKRVNDFNAAMLAGSRDSLNDLTSDALNYGHSNGDIQDKSGFVDSLATKNWKFTQLNVAAQQIANIEDNTAIVRQKIYGEHKKGNQAPGKLAIGVLMVWKKEDAKWVLYARQAFKLLPPDDVPPVK